MTAKTHAKRTWKAPGLAGARCSMGAWMRVAGLAVVLAGCGDGVHAPDTEAGCDPLADTGCASGLHCRLVAEGETRCLPPTARIGPTVPCTAATCDSGFACVAVEGALGCHRVCRVGDDTTCGAEVPCAYRVGDEDAEFGVCAPRCTLTGAACPTGTTCAPSADLGFPICVAVGPATFEQACDASVRCAEGLACLLDEAGSRCRALCDPDHAPDPCVVGQCTGRVRPVPEVGFCVGDGA